MNGKQVHKKLANVVFSAVSTCLPILFLASTLFTELVIRKKTYKIKYAEARASSLCPFTADAAWGTFA